MLLRDFFDRLFRNPDPETSPAYIEASAWAGEFQPRYDPSIEDLILESARQRYDDQRQALAALDAKLSDLLRFDAAIAVGLFAVVRITATRPNPWLLASFAILVAAMSLCIFARRAFARPVRASVREILDGIHTADRPKSWLAASVHLVVVAIDDTATRAALRLNVASYLTAVSMLSLFAALVTMSYEPAVPAAASPVP
jgi:hypothetical protein